MMTYMSLQTNEGTILPTTFTVFWGDVVSNGFNVSDAHRTDSGHEHILNARFVVNGRHNNGNTQGARNDYILGFVRTEVDAKDKHGPGSDNPVMITFLPPAIKWAASLVVSRQYHSQPKFSTELT